MSNIVLRDDKILSLMSNMVYILNPIFVGVRLSQLCIIYYKTIIEQQKNI